MRAAFLVVVLSLFLVFVFVLVVRAFLIQFTAKPKDEPPTDPGGEPSVLPLHVHEWRQVTEFVRQCRHRECAAVEITDGAPDGMPEYVHLMTSQAARVNPNAQAQLYPGLDSRNWGLKCPGCSRVIGQPEDLPQDPFWSLKGQKHKTYQCPYCQVYLVPMIGDKGIFYNKGES